MSGKREPVIQHAETIARRDGGWRCHYCGCELYRESRDVPGAKLYWFADEGRVGYELPPGAFKRFYQVDHVIPYSQGGSDDIDNLVLACQFCNGHKGTRSADEYREWLRTSELGKFWMKHHAEPAAVEEIKRLAENNATRCDLLRLLYERIQWEQFLGR